MITKKQYFVMILIFFTIFLLFQGLQVGRTFFTDETKNPHFTSTGLTMETAWTMERSVAENPFGTADPDASGESGTASPVRPASRESVLFIGSGESPCAATARQWAEYTKRVIRFSDQLPEPEKDSLPRALLLEKDRIAENCALIRDYLELGVSVICTELPDCGEISQKPMLMELLGIREIREEETLLHGIRLFSGFLLGGERIYESGWDNASEQDLALAKPWYIVRQGTETFVQGILDSEAQQKADKEKLQNEDLPAVIWRCHVGNGEIFAINGEYLHNTLLGMGILQAIMAKSSSIALYPVVNAQLLSAACFPLSANENDAEIKRIYGKSITKIEEETFLPMLFSASSQFGFHPCCFMSAKYDYDEADVLPERGVPSYFINFLAEINAEFALSTLRKGQLSAAEKMKRDNDYYRSEELRYPVSAVLATPDEWDDVVNGSTLSAFAAAATIVTPPDKSLAPVGYAARDMTFQQASEDINRHTFGDDLEMLGLETALAYRHVFLDMSRVIWAETAEDQWQNYSKRAFSNYSTYQTPFAAFDQLTASESDARVRRFLALDCAVAIDGERIDLFIDGFQDEAFFILRTHNMAVRTIVGGQAQMIEKDACLIRAEQDHVTIELYSTLKEMLHLEEGG